MYLEQEAYLYTIVGFSIIAAIGAVVLSLCYVKTRNKNLLWFCGQILFLILTFYFGYKCITTLPNDPTNSMYSENQSVIFAKTGICWAISMIFEFVGIWKIAKSKK